MQKFLENAARCRRERAAHGQLAADAFARRLGYAEAKELLAAEARITGTLWAPGTKAAA